MAEQNVVLRFATKALERAKDLGRAIKVTVAEGGEEARKARREINAAVRDTLAATRVLEQDNKRIKDSLPVEKRGRAALSRAQASARDVFAPLREGREKFQTGATLLAGLANGKGLAGEGVVSLFARYLPAAGLIAVSKTVLDQVLREMEKRFALEARLRDDAITLRVQRALETEEARRRRDPVYDQRARQEADRRNRERQARERRRGLSPGSMRSAGGE